PTVAIAHALSPANRLLVPLWASERYSRSLGFMYSRAHNINIDAADFPIAMDDDHPQEFFQTYREGGAVLQRSSSLKDRSFTLNEGTRKRAEELGEDFDDFDYNGLWLRRVTLKESVTISRIVPFFPFRSNPNKGK